MKVAEKLALGLMVLVAAIVVGIAVTGSSQAKAELPSGFSADDGTAGLQAAKSADDANSATTSNVYQQIVVAGWATRDYLAAIGEQNATVIHNQNSLSDQNAAIALYQSTATSSTNKLLTYLIVLVGLLIATLVGATVILASRRQLAPASAQAATAHPSSPPTSM